MVLLSCSDNASTTTATDTTTVNTVTAPDNSAVVVDTTYGTRPGSDTLMVGSGR